MFTPFQVEDCLEEEGMNKEDEDSAVNALMSMPSSPMPFSPMHSVPSTPTATTTTAAGAAASGGNHLNVGRHRPLVNPTTTTTGITSTRSGQVASWNDVDDVDIFTLFLGEMDIDDSYLPASTSSSSSAAIHPPQPSPPFTPSSGFESDFPNGLGGGNGATSYTWADALNNTDMNSSFHFNSHLSDDFLPLSTSSSKLPTAAVAAVATTRIHPQLVSINTLSEDELDPPPKSSSQHQQPLSPKSHAIREKNREAVRKCRQKKREREDAVAERIALLEQENDELKIQLRLGSPDRAREMELETTRRAQRIQDLLDSFVDTPQAHADLRDACHSYITHSGERSGDRAAATSGTLSRISRLIDPTLFAKFYLWHGTARDDYFSNPNGLWASISKEMCVSDAQTLQLTMRRDKLESLRAEIMDVSCKLADLQARVALRESADVLDANFVNQIQAQMTPTQLAKFILWLRKDKTVLKVVQPTDVLSSFLTQVMKVDPPAMTPQPASTSPRLPPPTINAASTVTKGSFPPPPVVPFKKPSLEMNRERVMLLTKGLWDGPKETLEKMAQSGFDPNVVLIDPNNGGEYHGIHKMLQYVHRIRLAFGEKITVDLREMSLENDKARATWVLHGTYRGKLNNNNNTTTAATGGNKHLKHVSFAIVCTYTFRPHSSLVQEMLVSWDAIGLMRQIGLLRSTPPHNKSSYNAQKQPPAKRIRSTELGELEAITQLERQHVELLAKLFSFTSEQDMTKLAEEILHPECVFQDSYMGFEFRGVGNCAQYIKKVRSPFPTLQVTNATLRNEVEGGGAALGSPLCLNWQIKAIYSGPLVKTPSPCNFSCVVFVTFDANDHTIDSAHLNWHAQKLMDQLKTSKTVV
ncbi:hypothetical protein BASA81_000368 [Batrachochytrium salamandrivorans]|nr:hypothetical protein BASA81_000368 [Batrachochytrium salamandrivorans]